MKILLLFFLSQFSFFALAEESLVDHPLLLIEPSFTRPEISQLISGAQRTIIVAGLMDKNASGEITVSFLHPSWESTKQKKMTRFVKEARSNLSQVLATLHPRFIRDEHHVIQVAILESSNPITASTILAPDFPEQFVNIFGPDLLIAIPSAHRIYVFSKLASPLNDIASTIRDDYQISSAPLSTEIFQLSHGELRAVGSLD
ncbi:MAG: hypothetical protein ACH346_02450 [Chthoniobacterales bacterium]